MSRLRRLVVADRRFFITCWLLPRRRILSDSEFATLAKVIDQRRAEHGFLLTAWVFLPDPAAAGHAISYPRHPLTISRVMEAIKDAGTKRNNLRRRELRKAAEERKLRVPPRYLLLEKRFRAQRLARAAQTGRGGGRGWPATALSPVRRPVGGRVWRPMDGSSEGSLLRKLTGVSYFHRRVI